MPTTVGVSLEKGDRETIDYFFSNRRYLKKQHFYRDAIIEKIQREEAIERERRAIQEGRSQIDATLLGRSG